MHSEHIITSRVLMQHFLLGDSVIKEAILAPLSKDSPMMYFVRYVVLVAQRLPGGAGDDRLVTWGHVCS